MKTRKLLLLVGIALLGAGTVACSKDNVSHDANTLPSKAHELLAQNFNSAISLVNEEKEFGKVEEYEVTLSDGTQVTFSSDGEWKSVDTPNNLSVPAGLVPTSIADYVKDKHNGAFIVGIEKEKKGFEVELSNGIDMKFDTSGNFISYDN